MGFNSGFKGLKSRNNNNNNNGQFPWNSMYIYDIISLISSYNKKYFKQIF